GRLRQRALDGVADRALAIPHRDYYAGLDRKRGRGRCDRCGGRVQVGAQPPEVRGGDALHLELIVPGGGIDVIELPLAAGAPVRVLGRVERLGDADDGCVQRELQPEIVEAAPTQIGRGRTVAFARL